MQEDAKFQSSVDYIYGLQTYGWKLGLERFQALCERLGNPQDKLKTIHIGGTNGKGSTTAMVSSILKSAGYKVGTYYSPYVYNIRERVQLDCGMISKSAFTRHVDAIRPHAEAVGKTDLGHPTEFEVKTALGLLYFVEQGVDFAVLEVGLGGRLDATNIVSPLVSVITNVTLDHMDRLGHTVPAIAAEKAGIIKPNGHLVTAIADPEAFDVVRRTCAERNSKLWHVHRAGNDGNHYAISSVTPGDDGNSVSACPSLKGSRSLVVDGVKSTYQDITLRMQGDFQQINAATAIGAIEALHNHGINVPQSAIREGLESAYLPGRLEVLSHRPTLLIDGAHNLDGSHQLAQALKNVFKYDRLILVMGMVNGHSMENVIGQLAPMADRFFATAADSPRASAATDVAEVARRYCSNVVSIEPVSEAVRAALNSAGENDLVCVTGSFYTISEVPRPACESEAEV